MATNYSRINHELNMKNYFLLASWSLILLACGNNEKDYDATGTFEATEVTVSAEQSGTLLKFTISEGDQLSQDAEVGLIDTTQVWLKIQQTCATKEVYQSQKPDMEKQIAATRQQLAKARQDQQRYTELVADGAAPTKMLDDATNQVKVLERQLEAQMSSLSRAGRVRGSRQAALQNGRHRADVHPRLRHLGTTAARKSGSAGQGLCRLWQWSAEGVRRHCDVDQQ